MSRRQQNAQGALFAAIRAVLQRSETPLTADEIVTQVNQILPQPTTRDSVLSSLKFKASEHIVRVVRSGPTGPTSKNRYQLAEDTSVEEAPMNSEQRQRRLIAAAMYYFGLVDAGASSGVLLEIRDRIDPELRTDLSGLIAQVVAIPPAIYPTAEERGSPAEVVRQLLRELRGAK